MIGEKGLFCQPKLSSLVRRLSSPLIFFNHIFNDLPSPESFTTTETINEHWLLGAQFGDHMQMTKDGSDISFNLGNIMQVQIAGLAHGRANPSSQGNFIFINQ